MEHGDNALLRQWSSAKNEPLTPKYLSYGSNRKVWWVCERGHEWQAAVKSRSAGSGCPICANRKLLTGENDLASVYPYLASQWHPQKNGALTPKEVTAGTHRKVWWVCEKGHEWQASVSSRIGSGADCPVCAGKVVIPGENDFAHAFPALAAQWHSERNGALAPEQVSPSSNRKVWWQCEKGHTYSASVAARTMGGSGCPYCAGKKVLSGFNDLATTAPQVAKEWHPILNGALTPKEVTAGAHRKVWWECGYGHVWQARIYARAGPQKSGCPICAGKVKQKNKGKAF